MSYIEKNLIGGEEIIAKASLHWIIYSSTVFTFLFGILFVGNPELSIFGSFLILLSIVLLINAVIRSKTTELAVTNKRVIAKYGFISRQTIELNLNKIEGLDIAQSLLGRIFNYGHVTLGGTGGKKSPIKDIAKPLNFRRTVNEQIEK